MIIDPDDLAILAAAAIGAIVAVAAYAADMRHVAGPAACQQVEADMPTPLWLQPESASAKPSI